MRIYINIGREELLSDSRLLSLMEELREGGCVLHVLEPGQLPADDALISAKRNGFSDKYLSKILEIPEDTIRNRRTELGIVENWEPVHVSGTQDKAYYYSTYNGTDRNPVGEQKPKVMILGGGPNRIGQGIEFDYCC